jgi:heat shock protein 1/8
MINNPNAETEEYEAKQKEIERLFNPIETKMYQGVPGPEPRCGNTAPQQPSGPMPGVDEVD